MSYLVDTNVISELRRHQPDAGVVSWANSHPRQSLYLSVLTLGEIRKGLQTVKDSAFRQTLSDWLEVDLANYFAGRLLMVDAKVADRWGRLQAQAGRTLPAIDSLLAATALHHGLTLVTRNTKDFEGIGLDLVNPWSTISR